MRFSKLRALTNQMSRPINMKSAHLLQDLSFGHWGGGRNLNGDNNASLWPEESMNWRGHKIIKRGMYEYPFSNNHCYMESKLLMSDGELQIYCEPSYGKTIGPDTLAGRSYGRFFTVQESVILSISMQVVDAFVEITVGFWIMKQPSCIKVWLAHSKLTISLIYPFLMRPNQRGYWMAMVCHSLERKMERWKYLPLNNILKGREFKVWVYRIV